MLIGSQLIWPTIIEETLEVSPMELILDYQGGSASFDVITNLDTLAWNVIANDLIIQSYSPEYGEGNGTVNFSYALNPTTEDRTFEIGVVSASDSSKVAMVSVTQECAYISLSSYETSVDYLAHTIRVNVYSNGSWSTRCDEDWVMIKEYSTYVEIKFYDNPYAEVREATVYFTVDGTEVGTEYGISQSEAPSHISIEPSVFNLDHEGGQITFTVNSSAPWRVQRGSTMPFIISPSSGGYGETEVTATVRPNTTDYDIHHNLYLETTDGSAYAILSVNVATGAAVIVINGGDIMRQPVLNPTASITVESTLPWAISSDNRYITFSPASGIANTEYEVTMRYNGAIGDKGSADVTIVSGTVSRTLTVRYGGL